MAKVKNDSVAAIMERFAFILFAPVLNFCRDDQTGSEKNLEELQGLLVKGYDPSKGVCSVMLPDSVPNWDTLLKAEMERRRELWEHLKGSRNTDPIPVDVFEEMFTHNGKLLEPKYAANMCFQRGSVFFDAQVERRKLARNPAEMDEQAKSGNDGSLRDLWPICVKHYADEGERISDQLGENTQKNRGATALTDLQQLRVGKLFWDKCYPQIRFRKEFTSDTIGQKIYYICELDARFPSLKILDRLRKTPEAEDYLPFSSMKHTDLTHLAHATDPDYGRSKAEQTAIKNNQFLKESETFPHGVKHPAPQAVVVDYFNRLKSGPITKAMMKRTEMQALIKQCGSEVIGAAVRGILENDADNFAPYLLCKHEHNLVCEIHRVGGKDGLEQARVALESILAAYNAQYEQARQEATVGVKVNGEAVSV